MKKKIGISFSQTNFRYYWNWFTENDLQDAELIKLCFLENNEEEVYKCDGLILTGGVDIHPSLYGGKLKYENKPKAFSRERDKFEEKIYKYSQENKKPLLGICRGLQLVNVLQGGSLIQDIQAGENLKHCDTRGADKQHDIIIENNTLLRDITLSDKGFVNSAHHQAINPNGLGNNLKINASAAFDENIIEGIEFEDKTNKAYMLCVQWHPERIKDKQSVFSDGIKNSFLKAI